MAHVLDTLATMGLDMLSNHYSIILPSSVAELAGVTDQLMFRTTKCSIPEKTVNTYDITKRGRTFSRPNGLSTQDRNISFTFRPDKKLTTYKALTNWMNGIQSNLDMSMKSDSGPTGTGGQSMFRAPIEIWAIDSLDGSSIGGMPNTIWYCQGCFPTSISGLEFDDESGDPLTVDVTLNCFNIIYPNQ